MKMEGKTEAALAWAKTWPQLDEYLKLNAILTNEEGDAAMTTMFSTSQGTPYVDGTAKRTYIFGLRMVLPWSDGYDDVNTKANQLMEQWRDWVGEQYPKNIPDWPGAEIDGIEPLYDVPNMTVYQEESVAEYVFQARIDYTE